MNEKNILILLIIIGFCLGCLLSKITQSYKSKTDNLRWPRYIEFIDSLLGMILLLFLIFQVPLYKYLLVLFLSMNISFHFTNVF